MMRSEVHWRDLMGRIHRCITAEQAPGHIVAWTACKYDVPIEETYEGGEAVTCPLCLSGETWGGKWIEREDGERFM